jgi:hypothetical protein
MYFIVVVSFLILCFFFLPFLFCSCCAHVIIFSNVHLVYVPCVVFNGVDHFLVFRFYRVDNRV